MLNLEEINNTIEELECGDTTFSACSKLASLYIVRDKLLDKSVDLVPESNIDEELEDIQSLFVNYMKERTISNLNNLLSTICNMLSELYHTCSDEQEKQEFLVFIKNIDSIITKTVI